MHYKGVITDSTSTNMSQLKSVTIVTIKHLPLDYS